MWPYWGHFLTLQTFLTDESAHLSPALELAHRVGSCILLRLSSQVSKIGVEMQKFQACEVKILVLFKASYRPFRTKVCGFIGGTSSSTYICDCWLGNRLMQLARAKIIVLRLKISEEKCKYFKNPKWRFFFFLNNYLGSFGLRLCGPVDGTSNST